MYVLTKLWLTPEKSKTCIKINKNIHVRTPKHTIIVKINKYNK